MNRRDFMEFAAGLGVAVIAPTTFAERPEFLSADAAFDPEQEYGRLLRLCGESLPPKLIEHTKALVIADARACLPPGTPFEIRKSVLNYGRWTDLAWYYHPGIRPQPVGFDRIGGFERLGSYIA